MSALSSSLQSNDYYVDAYSHISIHLEMLRDGPRTNTYHKALSDPSIFKDAIVLDVGCGTGILAIFAAKAGAKHVYALDASGPMTALARQIIADNGLEDVVTVVHSKLEDWHPPDLQVDVIVSEWMGYFLLYEGMLDSVLTARDRFMKPGGKMFPDKAILYLFSYNDPYDELAHFEDVCGVNMSAVKPLARAEPIVDIIDPRQVVSHPQPVLTLDLDTCPVGSTKSITVSFSIANKTTSNVTGIGGYFEVGFTHATPPVGFSTAPHATTTHWKQTLFPLYKNGPIEIKKNETLDGVCTIEENDKNRRDLDIKLQCAGEAYEFKIK